MTNKSFSALYAHKVHNAWWQDLDRPEQWGFLSRLYELLQIWKPNHAPGNQVQPLNLITPDGEVLYGWHILPVGLYNRNERSLLEGPTGPVSDSTKTPAFDLLKSDPNARLVINCKFTVPIDECGTDKRESTATQGALLKDGGQTLIGR